MQRSDLEAKFIARANTDPAFKQALLSNPKAVLAAELGVALPAELDVKVLEESATSIYLVLPAPAGDELSEQALEKVSGGVAWIDPEGEPATKTPKQIR